MQLDDLFDAGVGNARGVDIRIYVCLHDADVHLAAQILNGAGERGRFAAARRGHEVEHEAFVFLHLGAQHIGRIFVLLENVLLYFVNFILSHINLTPPVQQATISLMFIS